MTCYISKNILPRLRELKRFSCWISSDCWPQKMMSIMFTKVIKDILKEKGIVPSKVDQEGAFTSLILIIPMTIMFKLTTLIYKVRTQLTSSSTRTLKLKFRIKWWCKCNRWWPQTHNCSKWCQWWIRWTRSVTWTQTTISNSSSRIWQVCLIGV